MMHKFLIVPLWGVVLWLLSNTGVAQAQRIQRIDREIQKTVFIPKVLGWLVVRYLTRSIMRVI